MATATLKSLVDSLEADETKFNAGNASAGSRMRKTLQEIKKVSQEMRLDIQNKKNAAKATK